MTTPRPLIAVVDDEESVRRALARMLNAAGFAAEVYASGQEFLDAARSHRPGCVILDYQMPGLTGTRISASDICRCTSRPVRPGIW